MFRITYDSAMGIYANTFVVHKKDSNQQKFFQLNQGLDYCDVSCIVSLSRNFIVSTVEVAGSIPVRKEQNLFR